MIRRSSPVLVVAQFVTDLVLTLASIKIAELLRLNIQTGWERRGEVFATVQWEVYILVFIIWPVFFLLLGVFEPRRRGSLAADLGNLWLSITISMLVLASLFYLLAYDPRTAPSRLFFAYFYLTDLVLLGICHAIFDRTLWALHRHGRHVRRVLIVGGGVLGRHVAIRLRGAGSSGLSLVGYLSDREDGSIPGLTRLGMEEDVLSVVRARSVDEVIMTLPAEKHVAALSIASGLQSLPVTVHIVPDVFEMVAMKARVDDLYGLPLLSITEPSIGPIQARVKRAFDMFVSAVLLLLTAPFMLVIALWVKLDSPGPVLIHQRRVGAGGQTFFMHKFRSMEWRAEDLDRAAPKQKNDPRVTRAGKFIRRTSLDELPQLWNVLVGEMSLVGPRPELPAIVESYEPWQRKRFNVPPGMTGWWQVNGRSEKAMHINTEIDLYYLQNYSILLDLQILARTLGAVIRGKGAF